MQINKKMDLLGPRCGDVCGRISAFSFRGQTPRCEAQPALWRAASAPDGPCGKAYIVLVWVPVDARAFFVPQGCGQKKGGAQSVKLASLLLIMWPS